MMHKITAVTTRPLIVLLSGLLILGFTIGYVEAKQVKRASKKAPIAVQKSASKQKVAEPKKAKPAKTAKPKTQGRKGTQMIVVTPTPKLQVPPSATDGVLTRDGVIAWTNIQRQNTKNLPSLSPQAQLDSIAQARLKDMFAKQYFEHVSPDGIGASDIAKDVGYQLLMIGENIALGNFGTDRTLVQAWMDSPSHRENILNTRYTEIGVAVAKGIYSGRETWIGVQIFGRPQSSCTKPSGSLQSTIDQKEATLDLYQRELSHRKVALEAMQPKTSEEYDQYNQKVKEYNALVAKVSALVSEIKDLVAEYNAQVRVFNTCAQG